jgi:hypothetical protein
MRGKAWRGLMLWCSVLVVLVALGGSVRAAQETVLQRDNGVADTYEWLNQDFHYIKLELPRDWKEGYSEEVQFYAQRYGDVSNRKGTVVIWVPAKPPTASRSQEIGEHKKLTSAQFDLASVPEQPGWFSVKLDPVHLPSVFAISVYTFSDEQNGVKLGLTAKGSAVSFSSSTHPGAEGKWTAITPRRDKRNWLLRLKVRDTVAPATEFTTADLSGPNFLVHDDGSAEGFVTLRKKGLMLRCENSGPRQLESIFIYGKLDGQWFGSKRTMSILTLNQDLRILNRTLVPYSQFTNAGAWHEIKLSLVVNTTQVHYISVEPGSSATEQFLLGYDGSGPNLGSSYGTTGAPLSWPFETPAESTTNWMIRPKYVK